MSKIPRVKRALHLEEVEKENLKDMTPKKKQCLPGRVFSPLTGTCQLSPAATPRGSASKGKGRGSSDVPETQKAETPMEKLAALRSKVEASAKAFQKARTRLEHLLPIEGSSELETFFSRGTSDLQAEIRRHRELVAQVENCVFEHGTPQSSWQDSVQHGSSYEFLKSILN
ncbi:centromere protein R [Amia ocellicauda]|uniref:centromere protein R n=1 Tax=Amia ocellicauda TaxID=2972642 RepID=UPI003463BDD9